MDYQNENSDEPQIVGFESQPLPRSNADDTRKYALIGLGIAFVIFLFVVPSAPSIGSPAKDPANKYVAPESTHKSYRSAEEARDAVNNHVDQQMKKNEEFFDSFKNR